jgi:hypothetical protein
MDAKRFFYVCSGILLLVVAYTVGIHRAEAQGSGPFAGICIEPNGYRATLAITTSGDVYARNAIPVVNQATCNGLLSWETNGCNSGGLEQDAGWQFMGNVLGGTIPAEAKSWSGVKQGYRK